MYFNSSKTWIVSVYLDCSILLQFLRNLVLTRFNYLPARKKLVLRVPTYDRKKSAINCGQTTDMVRLLNTSKRSSKWQSSSVVSSKIN